MVHDFLEQLIIIQPVKKFPDFMEPKSLSLCSEKYANGPLSGPIPWKGLAQKCKFGCSKLVTSIMNPSLYLWHQLSTFQSLTTLSSVLYIHTSEFLFQEIL
jgi:hypothetical protein